MGLLSKFTVTPLLWACGLLLVAVGVLGVRLHMKQADVDVAEARLVTAATERDAWKGVAQQSLGANAQWHDAFDQVHGLLKASQADRKRLQAEGQSAIAAAQAAAEDADRTLKAWMDRYAEQIRMGDCAAALNAVQLACPAMEGY